MMNYPPAVLASKRPLSYDAFLIKREQVHNCLKELGLDGFELRRSEATYLPHILHDDEGIGGAIGGRSWRGHIMLIATTSRMIILDCKPLFNDIQDITYHVVAGVSIRNVGFYYTVTLHTRLGDFKVKSLDGRAAETFKDYVDSRCIENLQNGGKYD